VASVISAVDQFTFQRSPMTYVSASNLPVRLVRNPLGPAQDRFGLKLGGPLGFGRGADNGSLYATTLFKCRLFRIDTVQRGHYFR
jgi:hypothetical protein